MAKTSKFDQLSAAVVHAELIPANRTLTAGEIELVDDLAARLRAHFFGDRSEHVRDLLRRVSAVRTGTRNPPARTAQPDPTTGAATSPSPVATPKGKKKSKGSARAEQKDRTREYSLELRRIAQAGRPMTPSDAQTLGTLIAELEALSRTVPMARTLWTQALDTRAYLTGGSAAPDRDRSGVPSAGRISRPRGLGSAHREVLGGLPGTRRGH